jgi:hypothetical protein
MDIRDVANKHFSEALHGKKQCGEGISEKE